MQISKDMAVSNLRDLEQTFNNIAEKTRKSKAKMRDSERAMSIADSMEKAETCRLARCIIEDLPDAKLNEYMTVHRVTPEMQRGFGWKS